MADTFTYSGTELDALANAHNYYRSILHWFGPHLGARTVEIGAGIGTFAEHLMREPRVKTLDLVEPGVNNLPVLKERFAGRPNVTVHAGYFEDAAPQITADAAVMVNVLEHVEHERALLSLIHQRLVPGGKVLIFVPALPMLFGEMDRQFEHFRRYTKPTLRAPLEESGFKVELLRYMNLPGVVPWFITGRVLKQKTLDPRAVETYDKLVVPIVSAVERVIEPPFGQSLIVVASKS